MLVGVVGWFDFNFFFFDLKGILYGVENGKFYKWKLFVDRNDSWMGLFMFIGGELCWSDNRYFLFMVSGELYRVKGG